MIDYIMKINVKKLEKDIYEYRSKNRWFGKYMTEGQFCKKVKISTNTLNYIRRKWSMSRISKFKFERVLWEDSIEIME